MLSKKLMSAPATATGLTFVGYAVSTGETITIPSSAATGDLGVFYDTAIDTTVYPSAVYPSGWVYITGSNYYGGTVSRGNLSRKILTSGDPGLSITGMYGNLYMYKTILIFRDSSGISLGTYDEESVSTIDTNPTAQVKTTQAAPYVVIGGAAANAQPVWNTVWYDGSIENNVYQILAYKIFNASPASVTVALGEFGDDGNYLVSCSLTT